MGQTEDGDENIEQRFEELCLDLNMDRNSKDDAWMSFERISRNYTLEGDGIHWLACALYVSCRKSIVPTVGRGVMEGNGVSLTRLLRSAKLSLIEFFKKMKKWLDMANLPQEFRDKVDRLERNFAVSTVIFKKFEPIFLDIFRNPADEPPRPPRSRKQKRLPCTLADVFNFSWTMFVQVKGNFPAISDDLVNSYHLLLCSCDWFYANALLSNRKDLLNPNFSGLPENFESRDFKAPAEVPCIIQILCEKHEGLLIEAKGIKEHWWKPYIKKLFDRKQLKGKAENFTGILEIGNFEANSKTINQTYEEYVLNVGDFDERIFLGEDASVEIGTPAKSVGDLSQQVHAHAHAGHLRQHFNETRSLAPSTPLTGRRYLKEKETEVTPVSTATQSVSRLQALLSGRKTCPSDFLAEVFSACSRNPIEDIVQRVKEMGDIFCQKYAQPSDDHPGSHIDFAKRRLQLGESLYYKALENVMINERRRMQARDGSTKIPDFSNLLGQDIFHRSLFACCLEIVIFSYNSQRAFPWIVEVFDLSPYHFYKVIEVLIRAEEGLSRDVVKHLNHIEETILESLAWKGDSALWDAIKQLPTGVPSVEEVSLPNQIEGGAGASHGVLHSISSPIVHPALRRVVAVSDRGASPVISRNRDPTQSPTGAVDRFNSPAPDNRVVRKLFTQGPVSGGATTVKSLLNSGQTTPANSSADSSTSPAVGSAAVKDATALLNQSKNFALFKQTQTDDGRPVLVPVQMVSTVGDKQSSASSPGTGPRKEPSSTADAAASASNESTPRQEPAGQAATGKARKTGSLALFFRKVYHLASVRLRDLCERLDVDVDLRAQMWTCFEHVLMEHVDLLQDRHLDQAVMCAIYVMAKVTEKDKSFQEIMRCYRLQPQAQSHVYRSVLLSSRKRHSSGESSHSSKTGTSTSSSPVNPPPETKEEKKRAERLNTIRSTSTLPAATPSSQPPTPTRLAGTGTAFEFEDRGEDRGDLIKFYNSVFVKRIKTFALKFSAHNQDKKDNMPILSPLPLVRPHPSSPRRVSTKHSVYVSPHKTHGSVLTPQSKMLYCFNRSPAKDLCAINNMIRLTNKTKEPSSNQKRLLQDDDKADVPMDKRLRLGTSPIINQRLEEVINERQANGAR